MELSERLEFALEATRTGLWIVDSVTGTVDCDEAVQRLIGATNQSSVPLPLFLSMFRETDLPIVRAMLDEAPGMGAEPVDHEFMIRRLDTEAQRWVALQTRRGPRTGAIFGTARDITDVKRDDEQVHMLMREVTHRSKNLLAIIQAMARQTVKDSLSAAEFENRFSARLRGLSFSHELLASQDWRGASLRELAEGHLSHLRDLHGQRVQIVGPIVFVRPEAAQNLGLALNELSSNALRFGALSGTEGTVRLEWQIDADESGASALQVLWTETGGGREITPPSRQGFGHRVMERVVARALDADVTMSFAPSGLRWSLRIPLAHIANDAS